MNQNKITLEAVDSDLLCDGCIFDTDSNSTRCKTKETFPCEPRYRDDGRGIIWVIAKDSQNYLHINRIRELVGFLVSMASLHDEEMAKTFANELERLIPKSKDQGEQDEASGD